MDVPTHTHPSAHTHMYMHTYTHAHAHIHTHAYDDGAHLHSPNEHQTHAQLDDVQTEHLRTQTAHNLISRLQRSPTIPAPEGLKLHPLK